MGKRLSNMGRYIWRHKYFWTIALFVVIVGFVDSNSMLHRYELHSANEALRTEIASYEGKYKAATSEMESLAHSQEAVETVAREHLMMKTADEDIYEIVEEAD